MHANCRKCGPQKGENTEKHNLPISQTSWYLITISGFPVSAPYPQSLHIGTQPGHLFWAWDYTATWFYASFTYLVWAFTILKIPLKTVLEGEIVLCAGSGPSLTNSPPMFLPGYSPSSHGWSLHCTGGPSLFLWMELWHKISFPPEPGSAAQSMKCVLQVDLVHTQACSEP